MENKDQHNDQNHLANVHEGKVESTNSVAETPKVEESSYLSDVHAGEEQNLEESVDSCADTETCEEAHKEESIETVVSSKNKKNSKK